MPSWLFFGAIPVAPDPLTMTLAKIRTNAEQTARKYAQKIASGNRNLMLFNKLIACRIVFVRTTIRTILFLIQDRESGSLKK
jgi:hypothetical protein